MNCYAGQPDWRYDHISRCGGLPGRIHSCFQAAAGGGLPAALQESGTRFTSQWKPPIVMLLVCTVLGQIRIQRVSNSLYVKCGQSVQAMCRTCKLECKKCSFLKAIVPW